MKVEVPVKMGHIVIYRHLILPEKVLNTAPDVTAIAIQSAHYEVHVHTRVPQLQVPEVPWDLEG